MIPTKSIAAKYLLESFKKPLALKIPGKDGSEDYKYPNIVVDAQLREAMTRSTPDCSRPKSGGPPELDAGDGQTILDVVKNILEYSIQKFKYGETSLRA